VFSDQWQLTIDACGPAKTGGLTRAPFLSHCITQVVCAAAEKHEMRIWEILNLGKNLFVPFNAAAIKLRRA
jgi:hypothetical protein